MSITKLSLKVLSREMDPAEIRLIRQVFIKKERGPEVATSVNDTDGKQWVQLSNC
jgi:hypothetical protein